MKRIRGNVESSVSIAAPKQMPKVMPMRLVQFIVVCPMRVISDMAGVTGMSASKLRAPLV
ncbi:MAG: hypothetical protein DMG76_17125 [Acidobacteria bacterium]|nr:MAG: hypothetical protein DMG76_17125 [Acidobacteriota bacterium]